MTRDIDDSSENVLAEWPRAERADEADEGEDEEQAPAWGTAGAGESRAAEALEEHDERLEAAPEPASTVGHETEPAHAESDALPGDTEGTAIALAPSHQHAAGDLEIPDGFSVLEGDTDGSRRAVGVVVSRFNGSVTSRLLARALEELDATGVRRDAITLMVVPGAFELPLAATALAKTRRFACIVALGCVIRGDTPHFDYVAGETASGLQLAALETGVPVSFGVLTLDRVEQAEPRIEKAAEAVRSALEMADVFAHLRAAAAR